MEEVSNKKEQIPFDPFFMGKVENGTLVSRLIFTKEEALQALEQGNVPVLDVEKPQSEDPLVDFMARYVVEEVEGVGMCVNTCFEKVVNANYIQAEITRLKEMLTATDYIWLKTWEARIMGRSDPYSAEELSKSDSEREALRTQINALQLMLTS